MRPSPRRKRVLSARLGEADDGALSHPIGADLAARHLGAPHGRICFRGLLPRGHYRALRPARNPTRARKGCERGSDFEQAGAHDNDREEGGYESKCGHAARPDGEPRGRLRLEVMARHRLPHQAEQTIPACAAETVASKVVMRSLSWRTSR